MMKTKTEASQFKWVEWKNALCVGLQMATSAKVVELMGCYPFDEWINGLLPLQCCDYWALPHQLVWIWALPPISWFENGFEYGLYPIGWFEYGFYPICGLFEGLYPHLWFVWRALSPSVVCLKGFTPTVFWFISRDVTPNKECWVFVLRCRTTSFLDLPKLVSTVLPLYYPMSFIHVHSFMHIQHAYKYHSRMVALSVLF